MDDDRVDAVISHLEGMNTTLKSLRSEGGDLEPYMGSDEVCFLPWTAAALLLLAAIDGRRIPLVDHKCADGSPTYFVIDKPLPPPPPRGAPSLPASGCSSETAVHGLYACFAAICRKERTTHGAVSTSARSPRVV